MPRLGASTESKAVGVKALGFSPVNLNTLGSTEYTLVDISVDDSSSVQGSINDIRNCQKQIVQACALSPRADCLLMRVSTFSDGVNEVHGFKELKNINADDYNAMGGLGGVTALNDASIDGLDAICGQGRLLLDQDYAVNGIKIVLTDGHEYRSKQSFAAVLDAVKRPMSQECVESLVTILVGIGTDANTNTVLQKWKGDCGFDEFVPIKDASAKTLAKLAAFISKSISSQSQALGSGGPSKKISGLVSQLVAGITI
jgi:hypothetical protein